MRWNAGWDKVFETLDSLENEDLNKVIYINKKPLSVTEALIKLLAHYAYHVGQIVYVTKMDVND